MIENSEGDGEAGKGRTKRRWSWRKRGVVALGLGLSILVGISVGFSGCMSFTMTAEEVAARFDKAGVPQPTIYDHVADDGQIRVALSGTGDGPTVVFVHGSPGSWDAWIGFLADPELVDRYRMVAPDRPGFGHTLPRKAEPSMEVQARRIHEAVKASGARLPAIWVGHSLGGPVIVRLAEDFPEAVSGLVLVAPSIDPELEKRRWFNYVGKFPLVRWSISREWRNSNDEIFPHKEELKRVAERLDKVTAPIIVVQGSSDSLVDPRNADFVKRAFPNAPVKVTMLEGVDHFIPWTNPEEIVKAVDELAR